MSKQASDFGQSQFSVKWNLQKNLSNGLSSLQQNGEFVDMTLAADGHLVKVHQLVMALASPYIKALISSAETPHPVVFLNKVSHTTLCQLLEYIYTGEVLLQADHLNEFVQAGRELHIKGIEDMSSDIPDSSYVEDSLTTQQISESDNVDKKVYYEVSNEVNLNPLEEDVREFTYEESIQDNTKDQQMNEHYILSDATPVVTSAKPKAAASSTMQYTVSNQGSLQMTLNRFIYNLKYKTQKNIRQWRCVDYLSSVKCPAYVMSKGDMILKRVAIHNHPFHDKRILKKVKSGLIYAALDEAEHASRDSKGKPQSICLMDEQESEISEV